MIPVEFVYGILDELDDFDVLCSMRNVCIRLDKIIESYPRYQTLTTCEISDEKLEKLPPKNLVYAIRNNAVIENTSIIVYLSLVVSLVCRSQPLLNFIAHVVWTKTMIFLKILQYDIYLSH